MCERSVQRKEEAPKRIPRIEASNLVDLCRTPDVGQVYHRPTTSSKALQRPASGVLTSSTATQTRQGSSLYKNQRDSQSVLMVARVSTCAPSGGGNLPILGKNRATFKALWQKSRRVRPLNDNSGPVRESDREKALSTRTYGSDQGKAVAMAKTSRNPKQVETMSRFYFLPEDYQPGQKTLYLAKSLGLSDKQVADQLAKCMDHQYKRPMIDPDRCFRNWLRNSIKFGDAVPATVPSYRKPQELTEEQRKADSAKAWADMNRLKAIK